MTSDGNRHAIARIKPEFKNNQGRQNQADRSNYALREQTSNRKTICVCILTPYMDFLVWGIFFLLKHFKLSPDSQASRLTGRHSYIRLPSSGFM